MTRATTRLRQAMVPGPSFNLADLLEIVADTLADRPALIAGERRLTFAELDERANRLGHVLLGIGARRGDHVGILSWNCAEWVESFFGCLKAGVVPINLNYRYTAKELRVVLEDCEAVAVVVHPGLDDLLAKADACREKKRLVLRIGDELEALADEASSRRDFEARSGDDRYILYTGGTTGAPKGVVWRQEDLFFAALGGSNLVVESTGAPLCTPQELAGSLRAAPTVTLVLAPLMHGAAQWSSCHASIGWLSGATVMLSTSRSLDPASVWRAVEREQVTRLSVVGDAMARPLLAELAAGAHYDTSSLRSFGSGGAVLSAAVKSELSQLLPGVAIVDTYGASEAGTTASSLGAGDNEAPRFAATRGTAVLDKALRPLPPGTGAVGRLARCGHIPLGYWKDPTKTAEVFVESEGRRWCLPGDLASVETDGTITMLGRGSACITTGGEKVFPGEVETVLTQHPAVADALVVGVAEPLLGEVVTALVELRGPLDREVGGEAARGEAPGAQGAFVEELQAFCRRSLAGYKCPRRVVVVREVPRTSVGKPDYARARALAAEGASTGPSEAPVRARDEAARDEAARDGVAPDEVPRSLRDSSG